MTATDINNNVTTTNITVVQSGVALNITYAEDITTQTAIFVSGTIDTSGYLVWVNGVLASQSGGSWTANNVPSRCQSSLFTLLSSRLPKPATSSGTILNVPIQFTISFTNQYINRTNAPLSLAIQSDVPYYYAVLLDNTNFGGASWTAYTSSNITASLGANQGWHTVWVGLCGPTPARRQPGTPCPLELGGRHREASGASSPLIHNFQHLPLRRL